MQIKRIEIRGFKSFAEKTIIYLDKGITNIVGPNGCGKSNIVDAVRWVLGEQSHKDLRSEKMNNVIFSGSKEKHSAQLAEVNIVIDNSEKLIGIPYEEIGICRRLFRDGASQYQINGTSCRLKDITDLLLDTGFGNKSYNIIEYKHVDNIIQNKEKARKTLLEEAAGIGKYRLRKKQTFDKLEATKQDLERVNDMLFEIEKNLKVLEGQAKKLKRYEKIKEKYKKLSINLFIKNIESLNNEIKEIELDTDKQEQNRLQIISTYDNMSAELEQMKLDLVHVEDEMNAMLHATNEQEKEILNLENEKKLLKEKKSNVVYKLNELKIQKRDIELKLNKADWNVKEINIRLNRDIKTLEEKSDEVRRLSSEKDEMENVLKEKQKQIIDFNKEIADIKDKLHAVEREKGVHGERRKNAENQIGVWDKKIENCRKDLEEIGSSLEQWKAEKANILESLGKEKGKREGIEKEIEQERNLLEQTKEKRFRIQNEISVKEKEVDVIQAFTDSFEGFSETVKFIKQDIESAVHVPLLSDILNCEERYRRVLQTALEEYLNYFVVDHSAEALNIIKVLSNEAKGKANFFILEECEKDRTNEHKRREAERLIDKVEYDKKYDELLELLLGEVYILNDAVLNTTKPIGNELFINEGGTLLKGTYSMYGGSIGLLEGSKIGKKSDILLLNNEIEKLNEALETIQQEMESAQERLEVLDTEKRTYLNIESFEKNLRDKEDKILSVEAKILQTENELKESENRKKEDLEGLKKLREISEAFSPDENNLKSRLEELNQRLEEERAKFAELETKHAEAAKKYNECMLEQVRKQSEIDSLEKENAFNTSSIQQYKESIDNIEATIEATQNEQNILDNTSFDEAEVDRLFEALDKKKKELQEIENKKYKARGEINETERKLEALRKNKEIASGVIKELVEKKSKNEAQKTIEKEKIRLEFELSDKDIEGLIEHEPVEQEMSAIEQSIDRTKRELELVGAINPLALDAYNEAEKRYNFIQEQKNDLEEAKISLLKTIEETDGKAKEKLMTTYHIIRENFKSVFRKLFVQEDICDIKLVDEASPLDSDIEILAMPKGKRPLTINQLSGGEKTLTSIAFLFALYLYKPTPFCILDEIDAPLDDVNIDKFLNLIKEFSEKSQFILITHNKKTMSAAEIIHGVTMIENGVSKLIPVDLAALN